MRNLIFLLLSVTHVCFGETTKKPNELTGITNALVSNEDLFLLYDDSAGILKKFPVTEVDKRWALKTNPSLAGTKITVAGTDILFSELARLVGVSSNVQNQLNLKAPLDSPSFTTLANFNYSTASRAAAFDSSKNLVAATTTLTQLNYLGAATGTTGTTSTNVVFSGSPTIASPTFSGTVTTPLTASRLVVTGSSSELAASSATSTQAALLDIATGRTGTGALVYGTAPNFTSYVSVGTTPAASGAARFENNAGITWRNSTDSSDHTLTYNSSDQLVFDGGPIGSIIIGAIDTQTPAANGAVASTSTLYLQSASATAPGLVNNTSQTFSGVKTFSNTTNSTSSSTGAIVTAGGIAAAKNIVAGDQVNSPRFDLRTNGGGAAILENGDELVFEPVTNIRLFGPAGPQLSYDEINNETKYQATAWMWGTGSNAVEVLWASTGGSIGRLDNHRPGTAFLENYLMIGDHSAQVSSSAGVIRLENNKFIGFRNSTDSADYTFGFNSSNHFAMNNLLEVTNIIDSGLTASRALATDGSNQLVPSATTATELGYVSGVTSAIQTQLGSKAPLASPTFTGTVTLPSGSVSSSAWSTGSSTLAVGGGITVSSGTASTVPYLDSSKVLTSSAVTPTELGYVSGVTSAIQTQLGTKAPTASPTFTGTVTLPSGSVSSSAWSSGSSTVAMNGVLTQSDATDSSSTSTGSINTAGGLGVAKKSYLGNFLNVQGSSTDSRITANTSTDDPTIFLDSSSGAIGDLGLLRFRNSRGTLASPTATQSGDYLGQIDFYAYNGSAYVGRVLMYARSISGSGSASMNYQADAHHFLSGPVDTDSVFTALNTTDSSSTSTGSLITAGGLGVAKKAFIGTTLNVAGASTLTGGIVGVTDGSSATAGNVGEVLESSVATFADLTTNDNYNNVTSLTLTNGDWMIGGNVVFQLNGATVPSDCYIVILNASGTSQTGNVAGKTSGAGDCGGMSSGDQFQMSLAPFRVSVSGGSQTWYLKGRLNRSSGTPQAIGYVAAHRIR